MTKRRGATSPARAAQWAALAGISDHKDKLIHDTEAYLALRYPNLDRMSVDVTDGAVKLALKMRESLDAIEQLKKSRAADKRERT